MREEERDTGESEQQETRERIVEAMRASGLENKEVRKIITEWAKSREKRYTPDEWASGQIDVDLEQADMMAEAGYVAEAIESLETTHMNAEQQNDKVLMDKIERKISEFEKMLS